MVRGHKGFERVIWAFKNVLNHSLTWLFFDLRGSNDGLGQISSHQPKVLEVEPQFETRTAVQVPEIPDRLEEEEHRYATQLLEWLTLVAMGSQRIQDDDQIDPYLSRYRVPLGRSESSSTTYPDVEDIVKIHWHGLIPPSFVQSILLATLKTGDNWFAFNAKSFDGKAYAFLHNNHHTSTWEYLD